jgi:CubicO group peptidase (beta-lactamase class C family)
MFELIIDNSYDVHSIIIERNGYLLTEEYFYESQIYRNPDGSKSYPWGLYHEQTSGTKSFMSILIGIALQEGYLDNINQTLYEFFADVWDPSFRNSTLKKNITIEQLLTHNAGLDADYTGGLIETRIDCINWALDLPLIFTPGKAGEFEYSSDGPNLLSGIITNVTGKSSEEFAKEYLFEPLGISEEEYNWLHDLNNISYGGYFFQCSPKVQAKLGVLCLNNGTWKGTQIVEPNYMKNAITDQTGYSCGYLFWTDGPYGAYEAAGFGGQAIYIIPKYDMTVGFTAGETDGFLDYDGWLGDYIIQFVEPQPFLSITTISPTTNFNITLTWTSYPGADDYTLYRHTSQITSTNLISATEVKIIMGTSTTDTVPGSGRWYYAIVANNETSSSDPSNSPYIDVLGPSSEAIPGYNLILLVGVIGLISAIIVKKRRKTTIFKV